MPPPYTIGNWAANSQTLTLDPSSTITMNSTVVADQLFNSAFLLGTAGGADAFTFINHSTTNSLNFAGNISSFYSGVKALAVTGAGATTSNGIIYDGFGSVALAKSGAGTLTLSGANTFSGQLTVEDGALKVGTVNNASANGPLGNVITTPTPASRPFSGT